MLKLKLDSIEELPEDVASHYRKVGEEYVLDVSGVVTEAERDRLKGALDKEKNDHKASKGKLQAFNGLDAEAVLKDLDEIAELRLAAGKGEGVNKEELEKLVTARSHAMLAPVERERDQLREENATVKEENQGLKGKERKRTISSDLRDAALKAKVVQTALDDIALYGENFFTVAEHDGSVVTKEGLHGIQPGLSPELFLIEMKEARPHWYPGNVAGGAKGSGNSGIGGTNPWAKDSVNITEQGRLIKEDREKATKMAAAAGKTLTGAKL
jgi:hypothetical protein